MKKLFTLAIFILSINAFAQLKPDVDTPIFTVVEQMPGYPGGDSARIKFLVDNMIYPKSAEDKGIQGTVYITFVIDETGGVTEIKVLRGIGGGCDEEAIRVVKLMPKWTPGKQSGKNVRVQFNMPLKFTLSTPTTPK
jgi:protein TonB